MLQKLRTVLQKASHRRKEDLSLSVTSDEVRLLKDGTEVWRFRWDSVTRIIAYKRDLFTIDLICLDFFVESQQLTYPTHEEMKGFLELYDQMHRIIPSIGESWWSEVAFPAFATNEKVLYEKPAA